MPPCITAGGAKRDEASLCMPSLSSLPAYVVNTVATLAFVVVLSFLHIPLPSLATAVSNSWFLHALNSFKAAAWYYHLSFLLQRLVKQTTTNQRLHK
jgi:hypothetical protein